MSDATIPFFIRRTLGLLSRRRFRYGEVVKLRPGDPTYLLTDPADVRHVLAAHADNYLKTPHLTSEKGRRRTGGGLITRSGLDHHDQRRLLQPAFSQDAVATYESVISDRTARMLERWSDGARVDLAEEMPALTLANILGTLFGDQFRDREAELAAACVARRRYTEFYYHGRLPFRDRLPLRVVRDHRRAVRTIDGAIREAIAARRGGVGEAGDLTAAFLRATYVDGSTMDDTGVRDEILPLTVTGYETVGDAVTWTLYLVARHPQVEARLVGELRDVLGDRPPRAADRAALVYTELCIAEAMRLYPPTWVYVRVPIRADVLPSGGRVPAGARLYLCPYLMHRHPEVFDEPEAFRPERFADPALRRGWQYVYFPFGFGAHRCIGEHLAKLEAILIVAAVMQRHHLELISPDRVRPRAGITLRPHPGVPAVVHDRP